MPKKRTSTAPLRLRTRIDTAEQINDEMKRTYRLFINKQLTHAEMSRRRELLVALRAGLPDPIERPKANGHAPPVIQVFSVPPGCFLSPAQIEAQKRGEPFVDIALCTPMQLEHDEPALLEHTPQPARFAEPEFVPQTERESPPLAALEAKLLAMGHDQLLELAEALNVGK